MAASTTTTTPALFRFSVHNTTDTTHISHTHPVPLFLCQPAESQQTSAAFKDAFIDVIALITAQHHTECMAALTSPCLACASPTTDCLKSPSSFLNLAEPVVVIAVYPVCGSKTCEYQVRGQLLRRQMRGIEAAKEDERKIYGKMICEVCGNRDAKRCAGCGSVGYCGKECQAEGWKVHKRDCRRGHKPGKKEGEAVGLPYETI